MNEQKTDPSMSENIDAVVEDLDGRIEYIEKKISETEETVSVRRSLEERIFRLRQMRESAGSLVACLKRGEEEMVEVESPPPKPTVRERVAAGNLPMEVLRPRKVDYHRKRITYESNLTSWSVHVPLEANGVYYSGGEWLDVESGKIVRGMVSYDFVTHEVERYVMDAENSWKPKLNRVGDKILVMEKRELVFESMRMEEQGK